MLAMVVPSVLGGGGPSRHSVVIGSVRGQFRRRVGSGWNGFGLRVWACPRLAPGSGFGSVANDTTVCNGVEPPRNCPRGLAPSGRNPSRGSRAGVRWGPPPGGLRAARLAHYVPRSGGGESPR